MMVPRAFAQNPLAQRQHLDFSEKEELSRRAFVDKTSRPPPVSTLSQRLSQQSSESTYKPFSDPVKIPPRTEKRTAAPARRPGPSSLQVPRSNPRTQSQEAPKRKESVQDVLSSTTIPIRRKLRPRPAQRLPNCDYVADFSKLLRDDVQPSNDGSLSGSWTNPQFEGLFGNIDGLVEAQMIVGSEGIDTGILSTRSISSESMPSLESPDDFSTTDMASVSPTTMRSQSDHRLRQMVSSEDCSNQHPLLPLDEADDCSGTSTPELAMSPPSRPIRKPIMPEKRPNSFKSSLTASLKALKSAARTVSNIASTPPLVQPDDVLTKSIFDFQPALTDDRRPPPSNEPPSAALRRYLNPHTFVPPDSPAQLHFWVDEKPTPPSLSRPSNETKPKLKIKKKYQNPNPSASSSPIEKARFKGVKSTTSQLPPIVPLATCIPSSIRTAHASSPPTWLEPDGTPSNKHRAAQALRGHVRDGTETGTGANGNGIGYGEGQPRQREPRENRDFLRVFVCEMNMRKNGKLSDDAVGHARLWLPPVDEGEREREKEKDKGKEDGDVKEKNEKEMNTKREKKVGRERWVSWSIEDL